ncbi:hypothetical protein [Novacetimonas hansenii]
MPGVTIPRGIAIEYGRNFGLRYDRGDMPSIDQGMRHAARFGRQ